jgi:uncharacterized membrane protein
MTWIIFGLLAPLMWAINNMFDQILMRGHFTGHGMSLLAAGSLLHIIPAIGLFIYIGGFGDISPHIALLALVLPIMNGFLAFTPYMKALEESEGSTVIPFFQLVPVLVFLLSWTLLGESVSALRMLGAGLIIAAAIGILVDWKHFTIEGKVLKLLIPAICVLAFTTFAMRFGLEQAPYLPVLAWSSCGYALFGVLTFLTRPGARAMVREVIAKRQPVLACIVLFQETCYYISNAFFLLALALAPAAGLVSTLGGFQPAFVLILSFLGYRLRPAYFEPPKKGRLLVWHVSCLLLMLTGLYLIYGS